MATATAATAVAAATVSTTTVASAAMPSITTVPAMSVISVSMPSVRGANRVDCRTSATASEVGRVDRPSVAARAEGAGVKPLCLFLGVPLIFGSTSYMGIVVDDSAEQGIAVGGVLCRVEDVLMPELIQIVVAFLGAPGNQHEAWLSL